MFLDDYRREKERDARKRYSIGDLWAMYQASLGDRPSATTMGFEWRALSKRFADLMPGMVTDELCKAHTDERLAAGRKAGTIWTELGRLRMVFAWSVKRGHIDKAPYVWRPAAGPPRTAHITKAQAITLLDACEHHHIRLFVLLAWSTAARAEAILELTWDRVDFDADRINFEKPRDGKPMKGRSVVPMTTALRAAMIEAKQGALTDHVIEWNRKPVASVKKALKVAGTAAGLPGITPHQFRHSAARAMAADGVSMAKIAQFLGHADDTVTQRVYARFAPDHLRDAAESLELGGLRLVHLHQKAKKSIATGSRP